MVRVPKIASVGDLLVEFVAAGKNGHHRKADTYSGPYPSGAAGIFIDQAARCGGNCTFVGGVGDDSFGQVVLDRLADDRVDISLITTVAGVPTGTAFVSYNDDGSRDFVYNIALSAAAKFDAGAEIEAALLRFAPDVVHVSGSGLGNPEMAGKIVATVRALHANGVTVSFDPNVRKELMNSPVYFESVRDMMGMCSIFLPSQEDAAILFPGEELSVYAARLFGMGMRHVVLKKGDAGAEALSTAGDRVSLPAHTVEVLDPTGAGDCFCATFVTLLAAGHFNLAEIMRRATAAGALAVTRVGPMEGNSHLTTIEAFLSRRA